MLWYKGWLETRFRLLFVLGMTAFLLSLQRSIHINTVPSPHAGAAVLSATKRANEIILGSITFAEAIPLIMVCAMLAGAGIATQPSFQASKGVHGSSLFTCSQPAASVYSPFVPPSAGWKACS